LVAALAPILTDPGAAANRKYAKMILVWCGEISA